MPIYRYLYSKVAPVALTLASIISIGLLASCGGDSIGSDDQAEDPIVTDAPIAYVKRHIITEEDESPEFETDLRSPADFNPGAALFFRSKASVSSPEINITDQAFATTEAPSSANQSLLYDVKDVDVSYDGTKIIFAMRAPEIEDADDDEQPTWNIWEYEFETSTLTRVIQTDIAAEDGEDIAPHYLSNGDIVFSSTRQKGAKARLLDEIKPQFTHLAERRNDEAFTLHIMSSDGSNIRQVSYNQSHDLDPSLLPDGRMVFTRWDKMGNRDRMSLYTMNQDGTNLSLLYGVHSHDTGTEGSNIQFTQARALGNDELLVALQPYTTSTASKQFISIPFNDYSENDQLKDGRPALVAAQSNVTHFDLRSDESLSIDGKINSVYPISEGLEQRLLVSWSPCLIDRTDPETETITTSVCSSASIADVEAEASSEAEVRTVEAQFPNYGIWVYNPSDGTLRLVVPGETGLMYHEAVSIEKRTAPLYLTDSEREESLVANNLGQVHIRSVYDFDGVDTSENGLTTMADPSATPVDQRTYRFARIVKAVSTPDDDIVDIDNTAYGRSRAQLMREIIGYVPIEPDGSLFFTVPANIPFAISLLDASGARITERHQNWLQVAPGETLSCNGCHTSNSTVVHGRSDATLESINNGAPTDSFFPNANPSILATMGQTMAQAVGARTPSVNLLFDDEWANPNITTPAESFRYRYSDLDEPHPTSESCQTSWNPLCRIVINYTDHIHPLWEKSRPIVDETDTVIGDNRCTQCHSPADSDGLAQLPAAQLDLSGSLSSDEPDHLTSYRELFFNDNEQEIVDGNIIDREEIVTDGNGNTVFQTDEEGALILDGENNPIPVTRTITVSPVMTPSGANDSETFFNAFASLPEGATVDHTAFLSPTELKLIKEWLDIGAQYINNPFKLLEED